MFPAAPDNHSLPKDKVRRGQAAAAVTMVDCPSLPQGIAEADRQCGCGILRQYVWQDGVPVAVLGVAGIPGFFIQGPNKIENAAQADVTLPRLRREQRRPPGQQRHIACGPNGLRALVPVDFGSDAASGLNGSNGQRCRPRAIWTH